MSKAGYYHYLIKDYAKKHDLDYVGAVKHMMEHKPTLLEAYLRATKQTGIETYTTKLVRYWMENDPTVFEVKK